MLNGIRILLVEDSADALEVFAAVLALEGAQVIAAASGQEALQLAATHPVDLIISDIGMPGMDGYMLIRELRKLPQTAVVPAIALTGYGRAQDVLQSMTSGFNAHLGKPVEIEHLKQVVASLGFGG